MATHKKAPISSQIVTAKSIYIVNETGNQAVLKAADDQFAKWGRFIITDSKHDADLVVEFTPKNVIDKWGNLGLIEMDVFPKGGNKPIFKVKKGFRTIFDMQRRTNSCILDLETRLERKHKP